MGPAREVCPITCESSPLPGPTVPVPNGWSDYDQNILLNGLQTILTNIHGGMTSTAATLIAATSEICNSRLTPPTRCPWWKPFRDQQKLFSTDFFGPWLRYNPEPEGKGPSYYIEPWDHLMNTKEGRKLNGFDEIFQEWFVTFLNLRGKWLNSIYSTTSLEEWMKYNGTAAHPFNISDFIVPAGGFKTFNQFFLRQIKADRRPLNETAKIVSPCDGGAFYLHREDHNVTSHPEFTLPYKSNDTFHLGEALPGYGDAFIGGTLIDILLWFTDYHHFHAPVDGTIIHVGQYEGSYNYDFDDYDPNDPYAPIPEGDQVDWYNHLDKHKRVVIIIRTDEMGLVAMIPIGFWGVGSITIEVTTGQELKKGDYIGHFGYGGSSILLAFEPGYNITFLEGITNATNPYLVQVRQGLD